MLKRRFILIFLGLFVSISLCTLALPISSDILLKNQPEKEILSNGLTLIYQKDDSSATSVVNILIQGGKLREPEGKEGVAFLTTRLCLELPNQQLLQRLMNQATNRTYFCRHDFTVIRISCLSENLEEAIKLGTQILKEPLFSGLRIGRIKEFMNHYRKLQEDEPINVAHTAALDILFNGSTYAGPTYGIEQSLKNIKKRDVENYFNAYVKAGNMIVAVSTNLEKENTLNIMQPYFEEFPEGKPQEADQISFSPIEEKSLTLEKDTQQTLVYMAFPLPRISERNYILAMMFQNLLGKGMNSKLWSLRTEKKLAYIVNSRAFLMKEGGMLEAYLETDQTKKDMAIAELKKTIQDLYQNGISAEELNITKIYSKGMAIRENETKDAKTYNLALMEAFGLGYNFLNRILVAIDSTTLEEFNAFIHEVINPEKAVSITVGPIQRP
jgi:predicted Zn-dependent peptidase